MVARRVGQLTLSSATPPFFSMEQSACARLAKQADKMTTTLLRRAAERIIADSKETKACRSEYTAACRQAWFDHIEEVKTQADYRLVDDLRSALLASTSPKEVRATAFYVFRILRAGNKARWRGLDTATTAAASELLAYLESSGLPSQLSPLEDSLARTNKPPKPTALAFEFSSSVEKDPELLKRLFVYAWRNFGAKGIAQLMDIPSWRKMGLVPKLGEWLPEEARGRINEKDLKSLGAEVHNAMLSTPASRALFLEPTLAGRISKSPEAFRGTTEYAEKQVRIEKLVSGASEAMRKAVFGELDPDSTSLLLEPGTLKRIGKHVPSLWNQSWIHQGRQDQSGSSFCQAAESAAPPALRHLLSYLAISDSFDKLQWLLSNRPALANTSVFNLRGLLSAAATNPSLPAILGELAIAFGKGWPAALAEAPMAVRAMWLGDTDTAFWSWLVSGQILHPARRDLTKFRDLALKISGSPVVPASREFFEVMNDTSLKSLLSTTPGVAMVQKALQSDKAAARKWAAASFKQESTDPATRKQFLKLLSGSSEPVLNEVLGLIQSPAEMVEVIRETNLLSHVPASLRILQARAGDKIWARVLLDSVTGDEPELRGHGALAKNVIKLMMSYPTVFGDELARFAPVESRSVLLKMNLPALVTAAARSGSLAAWIGRPFIRPKVEEALPRLREAFRTRPTMLAALEVALVVNLRDLPLITRLAFERWRKNPKKTPGTSFDSHYFSWTVPKKIGGHRTITTPSPQLKRLQRVILDSTLALVPTQPSVHGFVPGRSAATNATMHEGKRVVTKLDIKSFFPSTRYGLIVKALRQATKDSLSKGALHLLADLCAYGGGLPVGAPSSPALGNIVLSRFDEVISDRAKSMGVCYTRYADDLTFSGGNEAVRMMGFAKGMLRKLGYETDTKKELIQRSGRRQVVTGLVVNAKASMPRRTRKKLRAAIDRLARNKQTEWHGKPADQRRIVGLLAYLHMVNPQHAAPLKSRLQKGKAGAS
jgi:retron-type reverse transcriptase